VRFLPFLACEVVDEAFCVDAHVGKNEAA
jgi:hypothetical protein